jgi:TolB-like protein
VVRVKDLLSADPSARAKVPRFKGQWSNNPLPEAAARPGGARRWLAPVLGGLVVAVIALAIAQPWRKSPAAGARAPTPAVSAEVAAIRARMVPDRWRKGDFEAVTPAIDRLIQAEPDNADAWALRSISHSLQVLRIVDPGTAPLEAGRTAAEHALRVGPDAPLAHLAMGMHLVTMVSRGGDPHAAREWIDRAVRELAPDTLTRFAELGSYWLGYDFESTERVTRAWLEADPAATYPAWILTAMAVTRRQPAEAEKWAKLALTDQELTGARALSNLVDLHFYLRADLAASRAAIERVPLRQRAMPRVVYWRALLAMAGQQWDQALQELAQIADPFLYDTSYNGPKALLAGMAHQRAGRAEAAQIQFREAERLLQEKLAADPDNEALRAGLAVTLACAGRADEARRELALVEPLVKGRAPTVYRHRLVVALAQAHGELHDYAGMAFWLRKLFAEPSGVPLTPASLRLDPRFNPAIDAPEIQALLQEFAALDQPAAAAPAQSEAKSVAVLAFANLSGDPAQEYFSDGLTEEILTALANERDLRVPGRTSVFSFKGKAMAAPEIARALSVAQVVEGSVRKSGNQVRITVSLTRASDGFSEPLGTFTEQLDDIFALQEKVARAVVEKLTKRTATATAIVVQTKNPVAYDTYLRARARQMNVISSVNAPETLRMYEEVIRIDPQYALPWARISQLYEMMVSSGYDRSPETRAKADEAAATALRLAPDLPEGHLAMAMVRLTVRRDADAAQAELNEAERLRPNDPEAPWIQARIEFARGRWDENFSRLILRAAALDPRNALSLYSMGSALNSTGRFAEADRLLGQSLAVAFNARAVSDRSLNYLAWTGDAPGALAMLDTFPVTEVGGYMPFLTVRAAARERQGNLAGAASDCEMVRKAVAAGTYTTSGARGQRIRATILLARLEARQGREARATELLREALAEARQLAGELGDDVVVTNYVAVGEASLGQDAAARATTERAIRLAEQARVAAAAIDARRSQAAVLALLGDTATAVAELRALHEKGHAFGYRLRHEAEWERLRGDLKFQQLMKEAEARADAQPRPAL